jgi:hypothetical protein
MGQFFKIFNALSAAAFCLLAYPGIFSGLSNDGKQGTALILFVGTPIAVIFATVNLTKAFRWEPPLFIPGNCYQGLNLNLRPILVTV